MECLFFLGLYFYLFLTALGLIGRCISLSDGSKQRGYPSWGAQALEHVWILEVEVPGPELCSWARVWLLWHTGSM